MDFEVVEGVNVHDDNEMSIALTKNVESQHSTKYIDIQHHYIYKLVDKKEVTMK